jgi:isopentenyldiphosphate isomerase
MAMDLVAELASTSGEVVFIGILPLGLERLPHRRAIDDCSGRVQILLLCESDSDLFARSLSTDTPLAQPRLGFAQMRFRRNLLHDLSANNPAITALNLYVPVSVYVARFGDRIFASPVTERVPTLADYVEVTPEHAWFSIVSQYVEFYTGSGYGRRFAGKRSVEAIELYDQDRAPRGIFPRNCFYDTDFHQYVIWDFVFDRTGRMLIHQRDLNAKDNRGMWDKSVGGHVDFSRELSSTKTAVRELIEELFEDESNKETMAHFTESEANIVYLGDWRFSKRAMRPLEEIRHLSRHEWAYFSLPGTLQVDTPRHMPDGAVRRLRVIADVYVFIANDQLEVHRLKNSQFRLVTIPELKTEIEQRSYVGPTGEVEVFEAAPDLRTIMSGPLRDVLEEISEAVSYIFASG